MAPRSSIIGLFAVADWLDEKRATAWLRVLSVLTATVVAGWILLSRGAVDLSGKLLGTDFVVFWTASRILLYGAPAVAAYDQTWHERIQSVAFPDIALDYPSFAYPPTFLLICLPLGMLPYLPSLGLWLASTGFAYWRVARGWVNSAGVALPVVAFPGVLINLGHGQNGFLSAALFGAGAALLQRRPFLAGLTIGALVIKPHLAILAPVALIAARRWQAVLGAAISATGLVLISALVFGLEIWRAFPGQLAMMRAVVEQGLLDPAKIQTAFGALRLWEAPLGWAYAAQWLVSLAAAATVGVVAFRRPESDGLGPVLIAATLLASPYLLDYDLILAVFPLAWLLAQGRVHDFRPFDKFIMLSAFILPLTSRLLAMNFNLPAGPLVLAALLAITVRRAWTPDQIQIAARELAQLERL